FLGIVSAFKNKKQYMVFLSCFFGFFIFLTIRDLIHTSTPFMRYSSFFTMFFIPFIFLGISRIVAFVYRAFCLENNSKSILIVIFIIIVNTYFAFFSTRYLIKEIPGMKYLAVERALADWISKNLNSGDVVFCSFDSTEHVSALLCNKFINIDYYYFFDINNKYKLDLDAVTLSQLKSFVEQCHIITPTSYGPQGEAFHIFLITKRGQPWEAKRVVFILNDYDYNYLNDNFPNLLEKIEIKYDGFFYSGSLMLEYAYVNKVGG
ncbi:MAG: hypothetical protein NTW64_00435, partial [Candidatus Omnitrophica bacterium]|nr:hypothetical protein [Candidatus Omnitrophota bacterium]